MRMTLMMMKLISIWYISKCNKVLHFEKQERGTKGGKLNEKMK
jgi:hypothetical protein